MKKIWIQCAVAGDFKGHASGPFAMTAETFDQCVNNFDRDGVEIPWDIGHQSEQGIGSAEAVGWISKLERRGNALFGLTEWLPETRDAIVAKKWKYASPAVRFGARDPKTGLNIGAKLTSMALVSRGFLKDLPPVQASDDARGDLVFCSESALEDENTEHELITMQDHATLLADGIATATAPLKILLKDAEANLAAVRLESDVAQAQLTSLAGQLKKMNDDANDALVHERYMLHRESRKLGPQAKRAMALVLASDPSLFHAEYPPLANNVPPYLMQKMGNDPGTASTLRGVMTVPALSKILSDVQEKNPAKSYDDCFTMALAEQATLMGAAA